MSLPVAVASLFSNQKAPLLTIEVLGYNITVFCLCLVSGVLIDIDHLVDILLNRTSLPENLEKRFKRGRMYVPFHGIENIPILAILSVIFPFLIFPTISYLFHIILDVYKNGAPHQAYFYIFRLQKILSKIRR